jgi:D-alanyl-D-alanine carboxypeptidase
MGFNPGSEVTLENALRMLMVKSANDIAITIADGLGGSVEGFADQMNAAAARLGAVRSGRASVTGCTGRRRTARAAASAPPRQRQQRAGAGGG